MAEAVRIIHDTIGHTPTVWLSDPAREHVREETTDEVVLMKDVDGRVIGFELLHFRATDAEPGISVETVVRTPEQAG